MSKVAVVTGSGSGIGRACALAFGEEGYSVVTNDRSSGVAGDVAKEIEDKGGTAYYIQADVSDPEGVDSLIDGAVDRYGRIDVLVNNAGIQTSKSSLELTHEEWQSLIDVNLTGAFLCARKAIGYMVEQDEGGVVINMSSVHQDIPWPEHVHYATSKGGIRMMTKSLALEFSVDGIRVNAIAPGAIKTRMNRDVLEDEARKNQLLSQIPMGRMGEPEEVADMVLFLASDKAKYVTGSTFFVDGGLSLYPSFCQRCKDFGP